VGQTASAGQRQIALALPHVCNNRILPTAIVTVRSSVADLEWAEGLPPSLTVMLANAKFFYRSTVRQGTQNIQNDCHQ